MKKFKFSLQSVLNMKLALEKQQKGELAAVEQRILGFKRELGEINARFEARRAERNEKVMAGISHSELATYAGGFQALKEKADIQKHKIAVAEEEKKRIQKVLVETMTERKMYEKLKEKQREAYNIELKREEEKTMNDFVSNKASSNR